MCRAPAPLAQEPVQAADLPDARAPVRPGRGAARPGCGADAHAGRARRRSSIRPRAIVGAEVPSRGRTSPWPQASDGHAARRHKLEILTDKQRGQRPSRRARCGSSPAVLVLALVPPSRRAAATGRLAGDEQPAPRVGSRKADVAPAHRREAGAGRASPLEDLTAPRQRVATLDLLGAAALRAGPLGAQHARRGARVRARRRAASSSWSSGKEQSRSLRTRSRADHKLRGRARGAVKPRWP
jgi:hypothetical protein